MLRPAKKENVAHIIIHKHLLKFNSFGTCGQKPTRLENEGCEAEFDDISRLNRTQPILEATGNIYTAQFR